MSCCRGGFIYSWRPLRRSLVKPAPTPVKNTWPSIANGHHIRRAGAETRFLRQFLAAKPTILPRNRVSLSCRVFLNAQFSGFRGGLSTVGMVSMIRAAISSGFSSLSVTVMWRSAWA